MALETMAVCLRSLLKIIFIVCMLKPFYGVVHLPLLFVDQLENNVLGRRAENNDKSAR